MRIGRTHCCCGDAPIRCPELNCSQKSADCCGTFEYIDIPNADTGELESVEVPFVTVQVFPGYLGSGMKVFSGGSCGPEGKYLAFSGNGPGGGYARLPLIPYSCPDPQDGYTHLGKAYFGNWTLANDFVNERALYVSNNYITGSINGSDPIIELEHPEGGCPSPLGCMNPIDGVDQTPVCNCNGPDENDMYCAQRYGLKCCPDSDDYCGECDPLHQMEGCRGPLQFSVPYVGAILTVKYNTDSCPSPNANCGAYTGRRTEVRITYYYGVLPGEDGTTYAVSQLALVYACRTEEEALDEEHPCKNECPFGPFAFSSIGYIGQAYGTRPQCCWEFDPYDETRPDATFCGDVVAACNGRAVPLWGPLTMCPEMCSGVDVCTDSTGNCPGILGACQAAGPIPCVTEGNPNPFWPFSDCGYWLTGGVYPA